MAGISIKYATLGTEPNYKSVGKKNTPLCKLFLLENHNQKNDDGEWETRNTSAYGAVAWGQTATDMVMELKKGDSIDLSAYIEDGDVKFRAYMEDNEWTDRKGEDHVDKQLTIREYKKIEKKDG